MHTQEGDEPGEDLGALTPEAGPAAAPDSIARLEADLERAREVWYAQVERGAGRKRRRLRFRRPSGEDRQAVAQKQALSDYEQAWQALERARAETEPKPDATAEDAPVAPQPAATGHGESTGDPGNDQLDERVRVAVEKVERHAVEEIEALEEDLERATKKAESLQAELERTKAKLKRTKAKLNQARAGWAEAERDVQKEIARRASATAEAERLRGELERLRGEVAGDVADGAPLNVEQSHADAAAAPERARRLGLPFSVIAGAVVLAAGAGLVSGVTTADSEKPAVGTARGDQDLLTYERTLRREVTALNESRTSHLKRLRNAHSAGDQAATAEDLATAHARAARALDRTSAPAPAASDNDSVVSALRQTADAYRQLAGGAATRRPAAYEAGATAVRRAEAKLQQSLEARSSRPL